MRKVVLQIICCLLALNVQAQKNIELFSPDGNIKLALNISDEISYTISCEDVILLENNRLQLELNNEVLGTSPFARTEEVECKRNVESCCSIEILNNRE